MTNEEAVGAGLAGQALAAAAVEMLLKLGHDDVVDDVKASALDAVNRSLDQAKRDLDKDAAKDHARQFLSMVVEGIKAKRKSDKTRRGQLS